MAGLNSIDKEEQRNPRRDPLSCVLPVLFPRIKLTHFPLRSGVPPLAVLASSQVLYLQEGGWRQLTEWRVLAWISPLTAHLNQAMRRALLLKREGSASLRKDWDNVKGTL